jgi:hypothetical protein
MWRLLVGMALMVATWGALHVLGGSASFLSVDGGATQVFRYEVSLVPISTTVEVRPETLNVKSQGRWVTAYVELAPATWWYRYRDRPPAPVRCRLRRDFVCPRRAHPSVATGHDGTPTEW